jgi:hypothetical protein
LGSVALATRHTLPVKVGTNFADNRRPVGRYSLLAERNREVGSYTNNLYGGSEGALYICSRNAITALVVLLDPEILLKFIHALDLVIIGTNIHEFIRGTPNRFICLVPREEDS